MNTATDQVKEEIKQSQSERDFWLSRLHANLEKKQLPDIENGKKYRLLELANIFGLNDFETDLLATMWICTYSNVVKFKILRTDNLTTHLSPLLVSKLYGYDLIHRLASESPLRLWGMVHEHEIVDGSVALTVDPQIISWLDGNNELDQYLVGKVSILPKSFQFESWNLPEIINGLKQYLDKGQRCRIFLDTDDNELAKAYATNIAAGLGLYILSINEVDSSTVDIPTFGMHIHRQAYLDHCSPYFSNKIHKISCNNSLISFPVQFLHGEITNINECGLKDIVINVEEITAAQRRKLWELNIEITKTWNKEEFEDLIWRFDTNADEIIKISKRNPKSPKEAAKYIRENTENDLNSLAQKSNSQFTRDDLIVSDSVQNRLEEIIFEARERARLWSNPEAARIFPQGRGLVSLFSGPPGSGKTMAAQVIANELGLDLLRIDLSSVVSKWVGETAENIQKILSSKMSQRAVLFFDEADALYSKRVDDVKTAQDKYSNMDSGHLMVALENYDGIVLMATNLRANIDPAFIRRIRHSVEFEKPTESARALIWSQVISGLFGKQEAQLMKNSINKLAMLEATGAQIKNTVLSCIFEIRRNNVNLNIETLAKLLSRELAKDGKGLSNRDIDSVIK